MTKESELLLYIPQRRLKILAPNGLETFVSRAKNGYGVKPLNEKEKAKLWLNLYSGILKKRCRSGEYDDSFRENIDFERRRELLNMARELTDCIVNQWKKISPNKEIAVLIFGSIPRGLVKSTTHPDPSNIDLAVIGVINDDEKNRLFDAIRPKRTATQEIILQGCRNVNSEIDLHRSGNAGVIIQNTDKLLASNYAQTIEYIKANATPLYDPLDIWGRIEDQALTDLIENTNYLNDIRKGKRRRML